MEPTTDISSSNLQNAFIDESKKSDLDSAQQACKKMCFEHDESSINSKINPRNQSWNSTLSPCTTAAENNSSSTLCPSARPGCMSSSDISLLPSCSSQSEVLQHSSNFELHGSSSQNSNKSCEKIQHLESCSNSLNESVHRKKNSVDANQIAISSIASPGDASDNVECASATTQEGEKELNIKDYVQQCDTHYSSQNLDPENPPLVTLQSGRVSVSDLTGQLWCEQQVVYSRSVPSAVRHQIIPRREEVTAGQLLHKERELEIQSYEPLETTSNEDRAALPYSNTLTFIRRLLSQESSVVREVHVFGEVDGVPIFGIIDELRLSDGNDFAVELVEFKTRMNKTPPKKPQRVSHEMQSMLYKYMYDDMVRGRSVDLYFASRGLDLRTPLGPQLSRSLQEAVTKGGATPFSMGETWTLGRVLEELRLVMAMLPFISRCHIHYSAQRDNQVFLKRQVAYDEPWMLDKVRRSLQFWHGHRPPEGVEVEEAHKCFKCHFQDHCGWVAAKTRLLQTRNSVNFT